MASVMDQQAKLPCLGDEDNKLQFHLITWEFQEPREALSQEPR